VQALGLTGRVDLGQVILDAFLRIFVVRELLFAPLPFIAVNGLQTRIGVGRLVAGLASTDKLPPGSRVNVYA